MRDFGVLGRDCWELEFKVFGYVYLFGWVLRFVVKGRICQVLSQGGRGNTYILLLLQSWLSDIMYRERNGMIGRWVAETRIVQLCCIRNYILLCARQWGV